MSKTPEKKDPELFALRRKFTDVYNEWHKRDVGCDPDFVKIAKSISPLIQRIAQIVSVELKDDLLECVNFEDEKKILDSWAYILNNKERLPSFYQNQLYNLRTLFDCLPQIINTYKQQYNNGRKDALGNKQKSGYTRTDAKRDASDERTIAHIQNLLHCGNRGFAINKYGERIVLQVEQQLNRNLS